MLSLTIKYQLINVERMTELEKSTLVHSNNLSMQESSISKKSNEKQNS